MFSESRENRCFGDAVIFKFVYFWSPFCSKDSSQQV